MGHRRGRAGLGVAFLDGTVVNAALPAIANDLDAGLASLQWTLTGYLLTLGSLIVVGGSLGDLYGRRRVFVAGLAGFAVASLGCAVAQTTGLLILARCIQGAAAAALVPGSLALISASFRVEDRGRAIGAWSGLAGISTAIGPFLGGWLIDSVSWRFVFLINLPLSAIAIAVTLRHVPESRDEDSVRHVDVLGGATLSIGLAGIVYALIEGPAGASDTVIAIAGRSRRGRSRRVCGGRGAQPATDGAARPLSIAPVLRRERRDLRRLRRARRRDVPRRGAPTDRPGLLRARVRVPRCCRSP